jgi:hypothetical protein
MISLVQLLKEATGTPKAIILGGGAGSGKTYLVKNFLGDLKNGNFTPKGSSENFTYLNPDDIVEKTGASLGAAMSQFKDIFDNAVENKQNVLWDTTAANVKNTLGKLPGYDKMLVMVYTHPMVSILQNAKRSRTLPIDAVIKTWNNVYGNIKQYQDELGDNFILIKNIIPGYEKDIEEFNNAVKQGEEGLKKYLTDLFLSDPEKFKSSFSKPFDFSSKEIEDAFENALKQSSYNEKEDEDILKQVKKEFEKEYQKKNEDPGVERLEQKLKSARNAKERNAKKYEEDIQGIVDKLTSPEFEKLITPISKEELQQKVSAFVK